MGNRKEKAKFFTVYRLAVIGLMSAMVFVCTYIHIDIPTGLGKTMIHFGNIICLLAGILFGPLTGGLAAGFGSAIYDLTDATFAPEFWITFIMKFAMAFIAGSIAHSGGAHGDRKMRNIAAASIGGVSYFLIFMGKTIAYNHFVIGAVWQAIWATVITSATVSLFNTPVTIICAVLLTAAIRPALQKSGVLSKLN